MFLRLSHIFGGRKKTKNKKKTSVKHIRYRLIGGCVKKQKKTKTN